MLSRVTSILSGKQKDLGEQSVARPHIALLQVSRLQTGETDQLQRAV